MPLIFEIEQKPVLESKTVFGVEIPLYGELTVAETIAVEKALALELNQESGLSNTEAAKVQVSAWLAVRLGVSKSEVDAQLDQSVALIDALWTVFYAEKYYKPEDDEDTVIEGKEESEPLMTLIESGTQYISGSQIADLQQNSLVILDTSASA